VVTAVAEELVGLQTPRIEWVPPDACRSRGGEAVAFARDTLGIVLDPWECLVLDRMLAQQPAVDRWAALEFGLTVPRQNGKSLILVVRELFGLLVLHERLIMHTAHRSRTSKNAYRETRRALREAPGWVQVTRNLGRLGSVELAFRDTNGEESVRLADDSGAIEFTTRTATGGKGLSGNLVVFDEAQDLDERPIDALLPTLSAKTITENPQVVYTGSAGTFVSTAQARIRRRGLAGGAKRLAYLEWSIDDDAYLAMDLDDRLDPDATRHLWPQANPALGLRITEEWIEQVELAQMDAFSFARERMGVGSWPLDDAAGWIIPKQAWLACTDESSPPPAGLLTLAVGASYDRTVSVAVCGKRPDGMVYAELTREPWRDTSSRFVAEVKRLRDEHRPAVIVVDDKGPVKFLVPELEAAGVVLTKVSFHENAAACAGLVGAVTEDGSTFRHRGQVWVTAALAGARKRDVGDGWVLDRAHSASDVTPLEVLALARWGFVVNSRRSYDLLESVL
jgi:hypothetical protein